MEAKHDDRQNWARARDLFLELVELDPSARAKELDRLGSTDPGLREWVERLLEHDVPTEMRQEAPTRFGPYETVRPIGEGGMGMVYLARRVDGEFEREVAIKLLKAGVAGGEFETRFLRERQTLALLDHEYVARLLDGGTTSDGTPYLVMEYVEGVPIDRYCRDHRLDVSQRLQLFQRVVSAVRHAHERGVIHRDLKPGNILVRADGGPRLLDFGIARPAEDISRVEAPLTRTGQRLFTPEYAAPEQLQAGPINRSTDVFALGVILYELLAGEKPWKADGGLHELEISILEREPKPPSRLLTGTARRAISGDLDTITLKCLAKSPEHRYADAIELETDLDLHVRGFPIQARRTGLLRRAWRHGRRRPSRAAAIVALVIAVLAVGIAWRKSAVEKRRRDGFVASIESSVELARALREQGKFDECVAELTAALEAADEIPEQDYLRALILGQFAVTSNYRRDYDRAVEYVRQARDVLPVDDPRSVRLRASLNNARSYALGMKGSPEAWQSAQEALDYARDHLEPGDELIIDAYLEVADQQRNRGETDESIETLAEAVAESRKVGDAMEEGLGRLLNLWGLALAGVDRDEEAIEKLSEAHKILSFHFGEGHHSIAQVRTNLGASYRKLGRLGEAREQFERAVDTWRRLEDDARIAQCLSLLGKVLIDEGEYDLSEQQLRESLDLYRRIRSDDSPIVRQGWMWLGEAQAKAGHVDQARASLDEALRGEPAAGILPADDLAHAQAALKRLDSRGDGD